MFCLIFSPFKFKCYKVLYSTWEGRGGRELGSWREFNDEGGQRKKKYNREWQKAIRKENSTVYIIYIHLCAQTCPI